MNFYKISSHPDEYYDNYNFKLIMSLLDFLQQYYWFTLSNLMHGLKKYVLFSNKYRCCWIILERFVWFFWYVTKKIKLAVIFFFEFHARVQKCHFGRMEKLPKWHFWTRAWNSKIFLAKRLLLRHYESAIYKKYS